MAWCWWPTAKAANCFPRSPLTLQACSSRNNRAIVDKVFAEKKPVYSNVFVGAVKKRMIVTVEVPVVREARFLRYFVQLADRDLPGHDRTATPRQDWTISIFDAEGINFARVPNPRETIGKRFAVALCRNVPLTRSYLRNRVARGRAADHQRRTFFAYRLDGSRGQS